MLSNYHNAGMTSIKKIKQEGRGGDRKLNVVLSYMVSMGGIDRKINMGHIIAF